MFRALRAGTSVLVCWRLLTPLLAVLLVFSFEGIAPAAVKAGSPTSGSATIRAGQLRAESAMRRADKQIKRLQRERQQHHKQLLKAKRRLAKLIGKRDRALGKATRTAASLAHEQDVAARKLRVRPNPGGPQITDRPKLRKQIRSLKARLARLEKKEARLTSQVQWARKAKQARLKKVSPVRIKARLRDREHAESTLAGFISRMLDVATTRAADTFSVASTRTFKKPTRGKVSQAYGCTGYRTNPRRGSCAHFHDGLDIVASRGAKVRASADGYVAYVGWNPWDKGKRAFVVIIRHAAGYETVYAHLKPVRKVRAGQRVARGQVIGLVGTTGKTTGPHVHWELHRNGGAMNPLGRRR
jgi:murein DD-endopeptidase MepM/ murein hydrolase activator NlpD